MEEQIQRLNEQLLQQQQKIVDMQKALNVQQTKAVGLSNIQNSIIKNVILQHKWLGSFQDLFSFPQHVELYTQSNVRALELLLKDESLEKKHEIQEFNQNINIEIKKEGHLQKFFDKQVNVMVNQIETKVVNCFAAKFEKITELESNQVKMDRRINGHQQSLSLNKIEIAQKSDKQSFSELLTRFNQFTSDFEYLLQVKIEDQIKQKTQKIITELIEKVDHKTDQFVEKSQFTSDLKVQFKAFKKKFREKISETLKTYTTNEQYLQTKEKIELKMKYELNTVKEQMKDREQAFQVVKKIVDSINEKKNAFALQKDIDELKSDIALNYITQRQLQDTEKSFLPRVAQIETISKQMVQNFEKFVSKIAQFEQELSYKISKIDFQMLEQNIAINYMQKGDILQRFTELQLQFDTLQTAMHGDMKTLQRNTSQKIKDAFNIDICDYLEKLMRERVQQAEKDIQVIYGVLQQKANNADILQFNEVFVKKGQVREIENYLVQLSDYLAQLSQYSISFMKTFSTKGENDSEQSKKKDIIYAIMQIEQLFERISVNSYVNIKHEINKFKGILGISEDAAASNHSKKKLAQSQARIPTVVNFPDSASEAVGKFADQTISIQYSNERPSSKQNQTVDLGHPPPQSSLISSKSLFHKKVSAENIHQSTSGAQPGSQARKDISPQIRQRLFKNTKNKSKNVLKPLLTNAVHYNRGNEHEEVSITPLPRSYTLFI